MAMKRGPLSNDQKKFIQKYKDKKTVEDFVKKFKKSEVLIRKYIDEISEEVEETSEIKHAEPLAKVQETAVHNPKQVMDVSSHFARNERFGVTVMTPEASMISDENKKIRGIPTSPKLNMENVHILKRRGT